VIKTEKRRGVEEETITTLVKGECREKIGAGQAADALGVTKKSSRWGGGWGFGGGRAVHFVIQSRTWGNKKGETAKEREGQYCQVLQGSGSPGAMKTAEDLGRSLLL